MERYSNLYSSPLSVYTPGCPVCIAAGALLKDNQTGAILAQLKIKNISSRVIAGLIVAVDAFDMGGSPMDGVPEYSYLDLMASRDTEFGQKNAILLPNSNTRRFNARCTKVFFMDGGVWEAPVDAVWAPLRVPNTLESVLGQELADQYRRDTIGYAQFIPLEQQDLWTCTCGTINRKEEGSCHRCSSRLSSLLAATNKDTLSAHLAEKKECDRIAAEKLAEEQRIAAEKAVVKKKKCLKIAGIIAAGAVICAVAFLIVTKVVIPSNDYKAAEALLADGDYDGAVAAFTELGDFKDSPTRILDVQYVMAENTLADGDYDQAIAKFISLGNFRDATDRVLQAQYAKAEYLFSIEDYDKALIIFKKLGDYENAFERTQEIEYIIADNCFADGQYKVAAVKFSALGDYKDSSKRVFNSYAMLLTNARPGSLVYWGKYEQDNNLSNGSEPIEWFVLDKKGSRLFVVSKYILDQQPYHIENTDITWSECSLRQWLNNDFMNVAFTEEEQSLIPSVMISNPNNPTFGTHGGPSTSDKIFLLSIAEAEKYLPGHSPNYSRVARVTEQLLYQIDLENPSAANVIREDLRRSMWALRSPACDSNIAAGVTVNGQILDGSIAALFGRDLTVDANHRLRPAMWIDLSMIE